MTALLCASQHRSMPLITYSVPSSLLNYAYAGGTKETSNSRRDVLNARALTFTVSNRAFKVIATQKYEVYFVTPS